MKNQPVSDLDMRHLGSIRDHVDALKQRMAEHINGATCKVLDVAPQDWGGVSPYLPSTAKLVTLDIDPSSGADIIADICDLSRCVPSDEFEIVICTEVLEHVRDPFLASKELLRILKPGGTLYASAPFNFRIHGPLPDNWRFTEHGWKELLRNFSSVEVLPLVTDDRPLMPIHYNVIAVK